MRANVLNDLSNVVKKGTGLACSWSQVGRMSEGGAIEHPLSTHSAPFGIRWKPAGEKGSTRVWKHVAMIFAVLVMSMANIGMAWGVDFTAAQITSGTTSGNISVSTAGLSNNQSKNVCSGTKLNSVSANSGAGATYSGKYIEIKASSGYSISTLNLLVRSNNSSACNGAVVFWNGDASATCNSYDTFSALANSTSDCDGTVSITVPSNTRTIRIYRGPKINPSTKAFDSGSSEIGGTSTFNVFSVSATVTVACTEIHPSLSYTSTSLMVGDNSSAPTLNKDGSAGAVTWTSSDEDVATVNSSGVVTAEGAGTATITASIAANGGKCEGSATANFTVAADPVGSHTLTWNLTVRESGSGESTLGTATTDIGTTSTASTSTYLTSLTDLTGVGVKRTTNGKSNNTGKIETPSSYDADKYVTMTFAVASGYQFTPSSVSIKTVAVSTTKDLKFEFSDANGSYSVTKTDLSTSGTAATNTLDFSGCDKAFMGTVTVKIYVYGAENQYRLSTPLTIDGTVAAAAACTAPNHVDISGTNKYLGGQTISLTAAAYSSAGTGSPIADANITGWQWQKQINSVWTNVENGDGITGATTKNLQITSCTHQNSGQYRCVVSTGATCSTNSDDFGVHVFSVYGKYYSGEYSHNEITWTSGTTGTATIHLNASSTYLFKVWSNDGYYYGNGENNYIIQPVNWDCGTGNHEMRLLTGPEGDYTFTVNIEHGLDGSPYVNVQVGYPSVTHPSTGYMYITKWWDHCYVHYWEGTNNDLSPWGYDPEINSDRYAEICGTNYWYFPVIDTYNKFIAKDAAGNPSNTTGDQVSTSNGGRYITHDGSWGWHDFSTYTITYAANGGGGSMSATSGICPDADQAITSNAFTAPTGCASFSHWTANVNVKVGGNTITAGDPIANGATIQNINSNITLTAVWKLAAPTITDNGDNTFSISGSMAGSSYYYTTNNSTPTMSSSLYSSAVDFSAGEADITAQAIAHKDGYVDSDVASQACTYHAADPCSEPAEVTNEIARFFVPCGLSNATSGEPSAWEVTNENASTGDNTFTTNGFGGGSSNWYRNEASGLIYGKLSGNSSYIQLKLKSGDFQAGDVVTAYFNRNNATKTGLTLKTQGSSYAITPAATAAEVETSGSYTLVADAIEADGSIKLFRANSSSFVNRIIVTRPACTNVSITTQPTTPVAATVGSACSITGLVAAGTSPTYQWYTCNADGSSATAINAAGAMSFTGYTTATLGLTPTAAGATYYKCVVSGSCGDPVTSNVVTVNASAAPASALITYNLNVGTSASTTIKSSTSTTDGTNITNIDIDQTNDGANGAGASNRTTKLALATGTTASAVDPDKYELFTFKVACGKKVTPSEVKIKVANVGSSAGGNQNYKAVLSDTYGHSISNTFTGTKSDGTVEEFSITNGGGAYFQGDVTLKLWSCKGADGNATAFRMGTPVEIFGEVGSQATPAATITWNTQPANGRVGDPDFAYDVTCSDGSAVTVTSANTTYATIVGGKLHYASAGTTHLVASATDACGNVLTPVNSNDFTVSAAAPTYSVTHSLTNVTATSGATGAGAATEGVAYDAVFAANSGYVLPSTITVTIGGSPATVGTSYTWNASTGAFQVPAAQVTGAIVITIAGETAPATKDIYYGHVKITDGALVREIPSGATQFFTNIGGTVANNTEISLSSTPSTTGMYYNSNNLTDAELSKSSNWSTSSGSNRYIRGLKFANGTTYTLALGTKVASAITFYGWCGSASKVMTIGGEEYTSSATKNTFAKHEFTKSGGFTGNVTITEDGDFYGILVITIQTAAPCTTPVIPALSNQSLCEGSDIAAWNATVTNAAAIEAAGESISYSWKKKGNDTELENNATFDLGSSATESQAGTYVVTVTVSKAGKASSSAYREVELSVTEGEEVTSITADKATVYPGNSVTLTATANTPATWQWYTCTSAEGAGAAIISGAESASYTIASAPAAGTYYYKAVATGTCGTASAVYTLTVSAASECEKYFWFVYAADATSNGVINNRDNFFGSSPKTGSSNSSTYKFTLDGTEYTATRNTGDNTFSISFTVPEGSTATLALNCKGSSSKPIYLIPTSGDPVLITDNSSNAAHVVENIAAGTYKVGAKTDASASWTLAGMAVQVCTASTCTDATPTATATNAVVCSGTELSITASGYETLPESIQWQKLNSSTSTWDNISGATSATYTVASAAAEHAGSYRVVVTKGCARTSNTVTIAVPSAPNFGSTVPASVSVMQTLALSISTVEATDAVKYRWYKSADATWDAGDVEIGTDKTLIKAYDGETAGSTYYIFCRAQNACGITTSSAITVNVTAYVEEDCATKGNEGEANFDFENTSCGSGNFPNTSTPCWNTNSKNKYLTYTAPDGKYFNKAKVTVGVSGGSTAAYGYSTDGSSWTYATLSGLTTSLAEKTINLPANVTHFRIGRNFDPSYGQTSNTFYLSKACFEYTEACTATTVTVSGTGSESYTIGSGEFTEPTFTLTAAAVAAGGTLTYSSSNEDIASVDDEGAVTFNGDAGTVTINASYAGDGTYCASEGSYTISVSCPGGAPKVVPDGTVNMSGCNSSVTLHAKQQDGTSDFADGTYQWFRNGTEIDGATSSSYTATQAGTYTVERTNAGGCTTPSTNSVVITSETTEPEVERLVPFQYYHVDKTYTAQMKMRHLFAVKNSGKLDGKSFKLYVSRNGGAATDVTNSNALAIWTNADGRVDTVMIDLNKLSGKYSENDELVYTCKAVDCSGNVSEVYKANITMHVIGATPTLALICSGSDKANGTRKTGELTVGGDFLTGYNKADLCEQTGNTSFDASTEWGLYTRLKANYLVTPVNGYAIFNKLNYEPFDILLLTDYPKASKSDAAATVLDDMADLVDFRPMLSLKAHMVSKTPSKWAAKGFTTSPVHVTGGDGRIYMNIVCYAHPMFDGIKEAGDHIFRDNSDNSQIVYEVLTEPGYENSKGLQGFEIDAAENFVTIGLIHYNATAAEDYPTTGELSWTPALKDGKSLDRMLVAAVERQTNLEARLIVLAVNCGAQTKFTETGRTIVHKCLEYLLSDATDPITPVADCSFTFDNGAGYDDYDETAYHAAGLTGTLGDGKWSTAANWGPDRVTVPGQFTSVRIAAPVTVDITDAHAMEARIVEGGSIEIPAGKALNVKSTIRRSDGTEISPTENSDIFIGSAAAGNGTLIFNNDKGDSKATVAMYTTAQADIEHMSAATSTWQYIGTPHNDVAIATYNYYDSWLYQQNASYNGWTVIPNGGPLVPFRGYCVTHPEENHTFVMDGTLTATTNADIAIPANKYVVVANSWTAPIDINAITDDDMEGITDKSIYFFNTGSDTEGTGETGTAAGTYRTSPIHAASYTGDWQIPSMQGFYVVGGASAGTLHLDYSRHVRPSDARSVVGNPMYAPRRSAENNEPEVAKLYFRGHRYYDRLIVLEREDFTPCYDSGWDGEAWGGNEASPMSYVSTEGRWDAVSAIPEFEGTVVGFRAGEDEEYTIDFIYDAENEPLYLFDTENSSYTQIVTGNAYHFSTADKAAHSRFILTRHAPQIATGCENLDDGGGAKAKKLLIEDKMYIMVNGMLYDATGKVVK